MKQENTKKQNRKKEADNKKKKGIVFNLLLSILPIAIVALLSRLFTNTESEWYTNLIQPKITPPKIVFPIMWSIIYVLLIICIYILLNKKRMTKQICILLIISGILNVIWTFAFFSCQSLVVGVIILFILLILAYTTNLLIFKQNKIAGALFIPYSVWLTFAFIINYLLFLLN